MSTHVQERQMRLRAALEDADFDCFIAASPANVMYASGYVSVGAQIGGAHPMAAVVTGSGSRLVVPVADSAPAIDMGVPADEIVGFGRFYFESPNGALPSLLADRHANIVEGILTALADLGFTRGRVGVDVEALGFGWTLLRDALPAAMTVVEATGWARGVRARKTPTEVELLRTSAGLSVAGIDRAVAAAGVGMSERELARIVATTMIEGDATPRFVVVTSGPRSALADALPTDRRLERGDLVRFDVGCVLDGYWSDIGRTAVVGEPDPLQARRYAAILAGEQAQLDAVRPGVTAGELFDLAMRTVEDHGIAGYRRQHCGHGIGAEIYEPPIVAVGVDRELEEGMTFCFETPYYELGWGGMMVEDTVVVTASGCTSFTATDRSLRVIEA